MTTGPTVSIALPLGETIDLAGSYDFIETARDDAEGLRQHLLRLGMDWDLRDLAPDITLSATYSCELNTRAGAQGYMRQAGTVSFALNF